MPLDLTIDELTADFPNFRVAVILAQDLKIAAERPMDLDQEIAAREAACRDRFAGMGLAEIPGIAMWRDAYKKFGIKKTSYRPSVERLVKNILAGRSLPVINSFVDAYNAISLAHVFPVGADDVAKIEPSVAFRYSRAGDSFIPLGKAEPDPPKTVEVVLAAGSAVLCRRWNWYQDARSPISTETTEALVTIQANGWGDLEAAAGDLVALLERFGAARCQVAYASADNSSIRF
ncbi:MAG: phenylalanine--tRNA ligase beta subunit-related protein [Pseudomonadota bacterium]